MTDEEKPSQDEPTRRPVRMSLEGYDPTDIDDACHFVGVFYRKAIQQGWTEGEASETVRRVTAKRAFEDLRQHIEPTPREPLSWRTQIDRIHDYTRGFELLNDDPNVKPSPFLWWFRGYRLARGVQSHSETLHQDESPSQERCQEQKPEHDIKPRHDMGMKF